METNNCPTCHAPIPAAAPGGFCPACLLRDAEEPPANGHSAPPLEEIAAAFPQLEVLGLIGHPSSTRNPTRWIPAVVLPFVLMAISRRAVEPGVYLCVFVLVISFVLSVLGWKETLGKVAVSLPAMAISRS